MKVVNAIERKRVRVDGYIMLNRMQGPHEEMTFGQSLEGDKGICHADIGGDSIPGRGNS